ncbi:hypothetical protein D0X99_16260 [Algoriphagus lacus]|uniref:Uncharacterized protein n=1 Tax=Algoriphagus lacus TaxID=2056311 RepID=A0A418PNP1_9BACT|nr:hypothetical protein [Algoriphagus lacus]RIW13330.1 hypothetical protein D0X99_16260 [Algoriphagus lacus]
MIHEQVEYLRPAFNTPSLEDVQDYFTTRDFPGEEGEVFFFYYQGMGWTNENGSPIRDWRAAASRWLWNLEN